MVMLSGMPRKPALAAAPAPSAAPILARGEHGLTFKLAGVLVEALPEGALWLPEDAVLVVSDLHFEKGSAFAARGQMLPPYDTRDGLDRLALLIARHQPTTLVALGDSFHDVQGPERLPPADRRKLDALVAKTDWVWIEGNHDPHTPAELGGRRAHTIALGALTLRHEPEAGVARGEVCGHLHPCAKVAGYRALRARCFATDGQRLVMPAFGAYCGGLNVCDAAFAPLFPAGCTALLIARGRVTPAPPERLLADA
jgi:DNA ligase-associated metallophosphoesterase